MCARTKQTMRFWTRHIGKTPIACSREPCADVRTTVLSQLNRDMGRRNNTTARVTTCSKRHVSAQVIHSFYLNGCSALGPTALEDYLISEQQDAHIEMSRRFAFSVQDSFLMLLSHAPKLLTVQRLWKTRIMRQREKICLRCLRPAKTSGTDGTKQNIPLCQPSTPTEGRVSSPYKKLCTAKQVQREAETTQGRERIRHFMFAAALQTQHKTSSHTCMTCLQIDSASHWTLYDIVFRKTRFNAQRQLVSNLTSFSQLFHG